MATAVNEFLLSLAAELAGTAAIAFSPPVAGLRGLWTHEAIESASAAVFTVLRVYAGTETASFAGVRTPRARIQADTRGLVSPGVLAQAWALHEALLDDQGRPRMHWSIAGKREAADGTLEADPAGGWLAWVCDLPGVPGVVGRDEQGRWMAMDNFEIQFERVLP